MGSVPAISVLILGIVVPALAGYIEVCDLKCLVVYSVPGQSDLDQKHQCDLTMEKKQIFSAFILSSLSLSLFSLHMRHLWLSSLSDYTVLSRFM